MEKQECLLRHSFAMRTHPHLNGFSKNFPLLLVASQPPSSQTVTKEWPTQLQALGKELTTFCAPSICGNISILTYIPYSTIMKRDGSSSQIFGGISAKTMKTQQGHHLTRSLMSYAHFFLLPRPRQHLTKS